MNLDPSLDYEVVWTGACRGSIPDHFRRLRGELPALEEPDDEAIPEPPVPTDARYIEATPILHLLEAAAPRAFCVYEIAHAFKATHGQVWNAIYRLLEAGLVERITPLAPPARHSRVRGPRYAYRATQRLGG